MKQIKRQSDSKTETINSTNNHTISDSTIHQRMTSNENHEIRSVISSWESKMSYKSSSSISKLSIKRKMAAGKPQSIVLWTDTDKISLSPITKRLYSLVNTKCNKDTNHVTLQSSSGNLKTKNKDLKDASKLPKHSNNQDHNKLRDFLKKISVEKSGLSPRPDYDSITDSLDCYRQNGSESKSALEPVRHHKLGAAKLSNSDASTSKWTPPAYYIQDQNTNHNLNHKYCEDVQKNYINKIPMDINMNSSNRGIALHERNKKSKTYKNDSIEINSKFYDSKYCIPNTDKNADDHFSQKKMLAESRTLKGSFSQLSHVFGKLSRRKDKQESKKSKIKSKGFNQHFDQNQSDREFQSPFYNTDIIDDNVPQKMYKQKLFHNRDSIEKDAYDDDVIMDGKHKIDHYNGDDYLIPNDRGDNDGKGKLNFTKRLFRLFTQSGYPTESKKSKFLQASTTVVLGHILDNLINLITILSVELIMTTLKANDKLRSSNMEMMNTQRDGQSISTVAKNEMDIRGSSLNRFILNQKLKQKSKEQETESLTKKTTLSFDLNGRLINNDGSFKSQSRLSNLNRGSWCNLYNSRLQLSIKSGNASTISIPNRYNRDLMSSKLSKIAFNSQVKEPLKFKIKSKSPQNLFKNNVSKTETFDGNKSCEKLQQHSAGSIFKKDLSIFRLEPNNFGTVNKMPLASSKKIKFEMIENGGYKMAIPIISTLDFIKLNDIFLLKDDLYNRCNKSLLYVRPKDPIKKGNFDNASTKGIYNSWFLHIESPTTEALSQSLRLTASRFPEWNLRSYIE